MTQILASPSETVTKRKYLSPTQLDTFCRCGEQYRRRYLLGEKIAPGIAALKGRSVHKGAEHNWKQKMETRQDLGVKAIQEITADAFDGETRGEFVLSAEEASRGKDVVIGEQKDSAVRLAKLFGEQVAHRYQPIMVEEYVEIMLPNAPFDLRGRLDMADDQDRIPDLKTSGKKKNQSEVDDSVQLTFYFAGYRAKTGRFPTEVGLDVLVEKKEPEYQRLVSTRTVDDLRAFVNRVNAISGAIEKGVFTPALPGSWWCSAKFCGFHSTCEFVNGKRSVAFDV